MVFPTRNMSSFSLISLFNCNILFKGTILPSCAESAVKPQSINFSGMSVVFVPHYRHHIKDISLIEIYRVTAVENAVLPCRLHGVSG